MSKFGLVKSFDIDDGQLDGLTPQECFVLGYELGEIDCLAKLPGQISRPVHSANRERIEKTFRDQRREFTLRYMQDDVSESWMCLESGEVETKQ